MQNRDRVPTGVPSPRERILLRQGAHQPDPGSAALVCRGPTPGSEAQYSDEPPGTQPAPLWEHFRSCGEDSPSEQGAGSQSRAGWGPLPGAGMEDAAQPGDLPVLQQGKPASGWRATMTDDQDEPLIHGTHTPTHPVLPVS